MKKLLVISRYLLLLPVIGSLILTLVTVLMGIARVVRMSIEILRQWDFSAKAGKLVATVVIETIDLFLVATVAYITALGLYKLFISNEKIGLPIRLKINTLKDLEDKIIGVIVAAMAVAFLGHVATGYDIKSTLYLGGGIALVIVALAFFTKYTEDPGKKEDKDADPEV